jgi:DNA recombination protein RmuC
LGWIFGSGRARPADSRLEEELRDQMAKREAEAEALRERIEQLQSAAAGAEARQQAAEQALAGQKALWAESLQTLRQGQDKALGELKESFRGLSSEALRQTQPEFLSLAKETLSGLQETAKGDLLQRQQSIETLVAPLRQQLETYQQRLAQSETTQSAALGEVKKHLETLALQSLSLSTETVQLRRVLSSNQARGRWGEETLRRVVEAAGMSAHCDFEEQTTSGDSKPDMIVRLPGDRLIIVDAKVPDLEFLDRLESSDTAARRDALEQHAAKLKATIKALGDRDYPAQFRNALDHVVLFLPAESLFSAALEGDRDLIVWAASKKIMLATPASLVALLRAVSVSWQEHARRDNEQAIAEAAQELYDRVRAFTDHLENIRKGLERANTAFNDAVGSYERSVRPSGERMVKLGVGGQQKSLAELRPSEVMLRRVPVEATGGAADTAAAAPAPTAALVEPASAVPAEPADLPDAAGAQI